MIQQVVRNEYGEPIGFEYVRDQFEEEEYLCEEMQMRAEDPMYAAMREKEEWIARATRAFEDNGVEVPYYVKEAWVKEMRQLQWKNEEEKAMKEVMPFVDFLNKMMPDAKWYAIYYHETHDEVAYTEIDYTNAPYKDDYINALNLWKAEHENDEMRYLADEYELSTRYMKEKETV